MVAVVFGWHQKRIAAEAQRWGQHLLAAQEEERQRIARELHDDLVPQVYAASLAIDRGASRDARSQLDHVVQLLRALAHDLHPPGLEYLDLSNALGDLVERQRPIDGVEVTLEVGPEVILPRPSALALFRVAQEGLNNALKHANAARIVLSLERDGDTIRLRVSDDGVGIPPERLVGGSFGIRSMRERLAVVGGALTIAMRQPQGTMLVAEVTPQ